MRESVLVLDMIESIPRSGPEWPKETTVSQYPTGDWFRDGCVTQSETFSESSGKDKPPPSTGGTRDTFFFLVDINTEECSPGDGWHHLVLQREKLQANEINIYDSEVINGKKKINCILITLSEAWMKMYLKVSTPGFQIRKFSLLLKPVSVGFSASSNIDS